MAVSGDSGVSSGDGSASASTSTSTPATDSTSTTATAPASIYSGIDDVLNLNPFADHIDLKTADGKKLFFKATSGLDKKYDLSSGKKWNDFKDSASKAVNDYALTQACVIIESRASGSSEVRRTSNLFDKLYTVDLALLRQQAKNLWKAGGPSKDALAFPSGTSDADKLKLTVDLRLRSKMLGEWIVNSIDEDGLRRVREKEDQYTFNPTAHTSVVDGACLLKVVFIMVNPTTRLGAEVFIVKIESASLKGYRQNVVTCNTQLNEWYKTIVASGEDYERSMIRQLFRIYTKTCLCSEFKSQFLTLKDKWETESNFSITPKQLMDKAELKYNNLVAGKEWKTSDQDDSNKLVTLLVNAIKKANDDGSTKSDTSSQPSGGNGGNPKQITIDEWRKKKTLGDSVERDGAKYWWCPNHQNGKGLYVKHPPSKCKKAKQNSDSNSQEKSGNGKKGLTLTDELKTSLCNIRSESDAMALISQLQSSSGN